MIRVKKPLGDTENLRVWSSILQGGNSFDVAKSLCSRELRTQGF